MAAAATSSSILGIATPFRSRDATHSPFRLKSRLSSSSSQYPRYSVVTSSVLLITSRPPSKSSRIHRTHRSAERAEVFKSMERWAEENILVLLKPVEKSWQPHDLLPDPSSEGFFDKVTELQERAKELPDEFFVLLTGEMLTEEALPTYQSLLSATEAFTDETAADLTPFQAWNRGWSAEENRHGDLLNKYLYLSGRVDMRQVEKTTHYLIKSGMNVGTARDPYLFTIYTSFQERVTFMSHGKTGNLARKHGDLKLAQICGTIASDEKRHEIAYTRIVEKLFELDPTGAMLAFEEMMKKRIKMPGHLMFDGRDPDLFSNYGSVVARLGVYSATDYIDVVEYLVERWNIDKLVGLSGEGRRAQEYVCGLAGRLKRLQERAQAQGNKAKETARVPFSWVFDRHV